MMKSKFILLLPLFLVTFFYPLEIRERDVSFLFADVKQGERYKLVFHQAKPLKGLSIKRWFAREIAHRDKGVEAFMLKSAIKTLRKKNITTHYAYRRYRVNKEDWRIVFYSTSFFTDQTKKIKNMSLASADMPDDIKLLSHYMKYAFYTGLLPAGVNVNLDALVQNLDVPIANARISSHFGYRIDPFNKSKRMHSGVDFSAKRGTLVRSIRDGIISFIGQRGGYGNVVEVTHGNGLMSRYAHLKRSRGRLKQKVFKGSVIAEVGTTGRSTGPHLHLEVLKNGQRENPVDYLSLLPKGLDVVNN
jgi:murein DD-endopeptidase MepM/ murein hydrolase activator NlpD